MAFQSPSGILHRAENKFFVSQPKKVLSRPHWMGEDVRKSPIEKNAMRTERDCVSANKT